MLNGNVDGEGQDGTLYLSSHVDLDENGYDHAASPEVNAWLKRQFEFSKNLDASESGHVARGPNEPASLDTIQE